MPRSNLSPLLNIIIPVASDRDSAIATLTRGEEVVAQVKGSILPSSYWVALEPLAEPGDLIEVVVPSGVNARTERLRVVEGIHPHTQARMLGYTPDRLNRG